MAVVGYRGRDSRWMVRKSGRRAARSGRLGHGLVRHRERDAVKQLLADDPGFLRPPLMTGFHGTNTPAADRSATMGIRGRTYFLGAQKDKYFRRCEADGMRQKGERLKKLVRLVPNDGQGRFDMEAPFSEGGSGMGRPNARGERSLVRRSDRLDLGTPRPMRSGNQILAQATTKMTHCMQATRRSGEAADATATLGRFQCRVLVSHGVSLCRARRQPRWRRRLDSGNR